MKAPLLFGSVSGPQVEQLLDLTTLGRPTPAEKELRETLNIVTTLP